MGVRIRPAGTADAEALAAILADVGWFGDRRDGDPTAVARHVESLLPDAEDPTRELVVADDVEGVVGYVHWSVTYPLFLPGPSLYLTELFVRSHARGRGIGSALLDHVDQRARSIGASRIELLNGRHRPSYERKFFPRRGYDEVDGLALFRRDPPSA